MLSRYFFYLHRLRRNLHLEPLKLHEEQNKRLRAVIHHAYQHVPFYHRKLNAAGIKPDNIESIEDLYKIPITTKAELQSNPFQDFVAGSVDISRCIRSTTSGSTGLPLAVYGNEATGDFCGAVWARALLENGLRLTDKVANVRNPRSFPKKQGVFRLLRRKYISVFEDVERQLEILEDYKPDVIRGFASSLALLASASRKKKSSIKPRLVFNGAEVLTESCRNEISSAFECDVLDYYGCVEFSLLMWECTEHMGYHMNVDSVAMEFLKDGEVVGPGERGEIVCTNLHNYVMPLIRYQLGDLGTPIKEQCSCGRTLPLTKMLEGRSDDLLTTINGKIIYATSFFYNLLGCLDGVKQFRVIQEKKDALTVQLAVTEGLSIEDEVFERTAKKIQNVFGEQMQVDFRLTEEMERDATGKLRVIISRIPTKPVENQK